MSADLSLEIGPVEALLRSAAESFIYPPTPPIAGAVQARLREPVRGPGVAWRWRVRPAVGVALAVLGTAALIAGSALAVPRSRSALATFFGLSHVQIESQPTAGPTPPALSPESFARPASLGEAQQAVDFALRFPTRDGARLEPDAVYLQGEGAAMPVAILVYDDYDLYQTGLGFFGKGTDPSLIHGLSFGSHDALWIDEGGHIATFLDAQGRLVVESRRTVGRATLLWEEDGITYRLETALSQAEAISVAESLEGT